MKRRPGHDPDAPVLYEVPQGGPDGDESEPFEELPAADPVSESQARSSLHGKEFDAEAFEYVEKCGATILDTYVYVEGYRLDALIEGANGQRFYLDAHGTPDRADRSTAGMRRQDTMLKFGFKALRLRDRRCAHPLLLVTSHMPKPGTSSSYLLTELNDALFDAVATVGDFGGMQRLRTYFTGPTPPQPLPAPWRAVQLELGMQILGEDDDA